MAWLCLYIVAIWLANWLIVTFGLVPVAPGLMAPAGVYAAGFALTLRDLVQERLGRSAVVGAIVGGALLSALLSPALALASGVAFLVSELADMAVYTPLRKREWITAIGLSAFVGALIDSGLFLWLAGLPLELIAGQMAGKGWATLAAVGALALRRRWAAA